MNTPPLCDSEIAYRSPVKKRRKSSRWIVLGSIASIAATITAWNVIATALETAVDIKRAPERIKDVQQKVEQIQMWHQDELVWRAEQGERLKHMEEMVSRMETRIDRGSITYSPKQQNDNRPN